MGDRAVAAPDQVAARAKIIHIDIDPAEIGKNMPAHIPIVGNLRQVLGELNKLMSEDSPWQAPAQWVETVTDRKRRYDEKEIPDTPGYVEPSVSCVFCPSGWKADAVLCADVGQNQIWSANHFGVRQGGF